MPEQPIRDEGESERDWRLRALVAGAGQSETGRSLAVPFFLGYFSCLGEGAVYVVFAGRSATVGPGGCKSRQHRREGMPARWETSRSATG